MVSYRIDIINPKSINFLQTLGELNLIKIKQDNSNTDITELLKKLRRHKTNIPDMDEIISEVELVRKSRYESIL